MTRRLTVVLAVVVVSAVAVVAAVQTGRRTTAPAAHSATSGSAKNGPTTRISLDRAGGSAVGELAPAFDVIATTGASVTLPAGKPMVLFFMAAWCNPILEAEALNAIASEYGQRVAILGIDMDPAEPLDDLETFAASFEGGYGYAQDGDGSLSTALGVSALDSTVVVDGEGRIVWRDSVPTDEQTLRDALTKAGLE